jgi:hypothetical protein
MITKCSLLKCAQAVSWEPTILLIKIEFYLNRFLDPVKQHKHPPHDRRKTPFPIMIIIAPV